jgi:hypothetical protein
MDHQFYLQLPAWSELSSVFWLAFGVKQQSLTHIILMKIIEYLKDDT